jgi:AP-3 complex subunit delta-1
MFEKTLNELIKGIRAHKGSEAKYIDSSIVDCRKEIKSRDLEVKAQAILKLAYVFLRPVPCLQPSYKCMDMSSRGRRFKLLKLCLRRLLRRKQSVI